MWVLIDNYDSFTYILHHYLLQTGNECAVYRNDELTVEALEAMHPTRLIISPGPETPANAGISMAAIARFHDKIPILGVCLGHQALGMHFGATLAHAPYPMHGKPDEMTHTRHMLYNGISSPFTAMRYHSLIIKDLEGTGLQPLAHAPDGSIMAMAHEKYPCVGIQYHPESIGTPDGQTMLNNWARMY